MIRLFHGFFENLSKMITACTGLAIARAATEWAAGEAAGAAAGVATRHPEATRSRATRRMNRDSTTGTGGGAAARRPPHLSTDSTDE